MIINNNVNGDYRRLVNMIDIIINEIEIKGCTSISDEIIDQCCSMFHENILIRTYIRTHYQYLLIIYN